jgi:hypothetical protein
MSHVNRFEIASWKLERPPTGIGFSPDGRFLHAYEGREIFTWAVPGFQQVSRFAVSGTECSREGHCRFLNGGRSILLIASDDDSEEGIHHLTVRDLESHALQLEADIRFEHYGLLTILFNPAENRLLLKDCGGMSHFMEFPSCARMRSLKFDRAQHLIYSPDESELWAVRGHDEPGAYREYLTAFDPITGKPIRQRPPDQGNHVDGLGLSPGASLLFAVEEKAVRLLDPKSWKLVRSVELTGSLRHPWARSDPAVAFAPDGNMLALSCEYNTRVCMVGLSQANLLGVFEVDQDFCVRLLSFSPDGHFLAIASYDVQREVKVWDVSQVP